MKALKNFAFNQIRFRQIGLCCLTVTAAVMFFTMIRGWDIPVEVSMLTVLILNGTALAFWGSAIRETMNKSARNLLLLGLAVSLWFAAVQLSFLIVPGVALPRLFLFTVPCEYLLLLPYAALTQEKKYTGLRVLGGAFCLGSFILAVFSVCIELGLPMNVLAALNKNLIATGEMLAGWWVNIVAMFFMTSIGLKLAFFCGNSRSVWKAAAGIMLPVELLALGYTKCTTAITITAVLIMGVVFFLIMQSDRIRRKQLRLCAAIGAVVLVTAAALTIPFAGYMQHTGGAARAEESRREETAVQAEPAPTEAAEQTARDSSTGEPVRTGIKYLPGSGMLRNRVGIWRTSLKLAEENPRALLFGIEDLPERLTALWGDLVNHTHNAWLQVLLELGLPGLLTACWVTWLVCKNAFALIFTRSSGTVQKELSLLALGIMASQIMEPHLFMVEYPYGSLNMVFLLLTGYLVFWGKITPARKEK